ncbi:MAG TPA: hypothetical protein VNT60_09295 [Deinococcales bacterium]|nr:hypothetical protein [Deinococcales bacterium]
MIKTAGNRVGHRLVIRLLGTLEENSDFREFLSFSPRSHLHVEVARRLLADLKSHPARAAEVLTEDRLAESFDALSRVSARYDAYSRRRRSLN